MAEYIDKRAIRDALCDADAITMKGVALLNQFPVVNVQWIPVTERLPNEYGEYLVLWKPRREGILPKDKLFYEIVEYEMDYNGIDGEWIGEIPQSAPMGGYEVCYWMELPPEPRKEET